MISKIISRASRAACLAELTSNPKSFFNCPDLHGGVPKAAISSSMAGSVPLIQPQTVFPSSIMMIRSISPVPLT